MGKVPTIHFFFVGYGYASPCGNQDPDAFVTDKKDDVTCAKCCKKLLKRKRDGK